MAMSIATRFGAFVVAVGSLLMTVSAASQTFPWQRNYAQPLPEGRLAYTPEPFEFKTGPSVFYIDFESGDDSNPGSREAPWKHHPWDPNATGQSASTRGAHTYVFKQGVIYRGVLRPNGDQGNPTDPIRLTRDPSWGEGEAKIYASELVSTWEREAHPGIEVDRDQIWMAEVDFLPRTLWMIDDEAEEPIHRLTLARWPNWGESDPNDVLREWPVWENPEWWRDGNAFYRMEVNGRPLHLGIDTANFTRPAEDYIGATVWSEWGIVMGSPYPALVEGFDEEQRGVAFRGPWTFDALEVIIRNNRYHLEDKPWMLDEAGEFWVERLGDNQARIYLRLPEDRDPNTVTIEAGRHYNIIDTNELLHVHISGLTFRFTNVWWDYNFPAWAHPDLRAAVIRLNGSGDNIKVHHNRFEHVNMPIRMDVGSTEQTIGHVAIHDNVMHHTEHGAVRLAARFSNETPTTYGEFVHADVLRNDLYRIGWRILSGEHGHAVDLVHPTTSHIAGNFLYRIAGWGISVFGGKPSANWIDTLEVPLSRHIIHQNSVIDCLLKSNDWGAIETWQGGTFYVFDNYVFNPVAFKHWVWQEGDSDNIGSFGHAYYLDGSFKNYVFNNIGAGRNNELGTRSVNTTAIQNIYSFENWFFNNTFHRFAEMTRQQEPSASRYRYLGNIFNDTSRFVFRLTDPQDVEPDPNAFHYQTGGSFNYPTIALGENLMYQVPERLGAFEETGAVFRSLAGFRDALSRVGAQRSDLGEILDGSPLRDADAGNFRPLEEGAAQEGGVTVFVPWALANVVGEWQFTLNRADPNEVFDEHWTMTRAYTNRNRYRETPRYSLLGSDFTESHYVDGPLANWTRSALHISSDQTLTISGLDVRSQPSNAASTPTVMHEFPWGTAEIPEEVALGESVRIVVQLSESPGDQQVGAHLHWMRPQAWGGFADLGRVSDLGNNRYSIEFNAPRPDGLASWNFMLFLSPDNSWETRTSEVQISVPVAAPRMAGLHRTVDIDEEDLLIEVHFRTEDANGALVEKITDAGYSLALVNGQPELRFVDSAGASYRASIEINLADGDWHHLLVELDRAGQAVRFYVNGRELTVTTDGNFPMASLSNESDFVVGRDLAVSLDFLRVAQSTLARSRTTIEELYQWQKNGPQYRDFAGRDRRERNAIGALRE